jgi:hypothetical protein
LSFFDPLRRAGVRVGMLLVLGKHDDQVDSTVQFLDWFKRPFRGQGFYELMRMRA